MSGAAKNRRKTLTRTPVAKRTAATAQSKSPVKAAVTREVAETKRRAKTGEAARETSARIARGEHPLEAIANVRHGAKAARAAKRGTGQKPAMQSPVRARKAR